MNKHQETDPSTYKDMSHLGLSREHDSSMMQLGEVSYPKYNYDDRFTDIEISKFNELF